MIAHQMLFLLQFSRSAKQTNKFDSTSPAFIFEVLVCENILGTKKQDSEKKGLSSNSV